MRINNSYREDIRHRLQEAQRRGMNWVVANDNPEYILSADELHFFSSGVEAMENCPVWSAWQTPGLCHDERYSADPIENVLLQLDGTNTLPLLQNEEVEKYIRLLEEQQLGALDGYWDNDLSNVIRTGMVFPVKWETTVVPFRDLTMFQVIEHRHAGGMIYEQGHEIRSLGKFPTYWDAREFMRSLLAESGGLDERSNLVLIGQYDANILVQDQEGYPLIHSGLALDIGSPLPNREVYDHAFDWSPLHDHNEPIVQCYYLYAAFDHKNERFRVLDDQLQPVTPNIGMVSEFPQYFNYRTLINTNRKVMNEKNYDYLKNQVKFAGFGEGLETELKEMLELGKPDFKLQHQTKFGDDEVKSTLHFKQGKESEMFFFNSYDLSLKQPGKDEVLTQTYYVGQENNLTLKERYNMLQGRAVFKEFNKLEQVGEGADARFKATDQTYKAWTELKFKETDDQGNFVPRKMFGFDLERTLVKYPIKELEDAYDKSRLIASLEKGNVQSATLTVDGAETKISLAANPRENGINFYDSTMQRMESKQIPLVKKEQNEKQEMGAAKDQAEVVQSKNVAADQKARVEGDTAEKTTESKRRSMKIS